jgi:hypothetical protein
VDATSVVHVIISEVFDRLVAVTAEITGPPLETVVKVEFVEVEDTLEAFAETTSKL